MSTEVEAVVEPVEGIKMDPYEPQPLKYDEVFPPLDVPAENVGAGLPAAVLQSVGLVSYAKMAVKSSTITQVFHVPLEERRYREIDQGFGESNSIANQICNTIRQKTGANIEMSLARDQSLTIVITGKAEDVMKARRELMNKLQTQANVSISIPREHHRFIIGRKGEKMKELELSTATKITIPKPDDPSPDFVHITGTKEGIERASHEIRLISEEQAKRALERLSIPHVYHPFICGPGNSHSKELSAATGAQIHVPPLSAQKDEIVVCGEKDGVAEACQRILQIYEDKKTKTTTVSLEVRKNQHRYVIGPRGSNISDILEKTNVSVEMPTSISPSETITLRGEQAELGPAISMVYAKANSIIIDHVQAESWLHRFIIGRKGKNIDNITQNLSKVHIEFAEGSDKIDLEGPPEQVAEAKKHLEQVVTELRNTLSFDTMTINPRFVKHIIGKSGANVNRIKQNYGVSIRIPTEQENSGEIRIEGSPDGVAQAKAELSEMAQRMENEKQRDIIIEYRFHRLIIGSGGENIKEIREKFNQVQITFPSAGKKSDIVVLRGPKGDVDKCCTFLQHMANQLTTDNYEEQVSVMKQFHKNIIGRGGATITKIKEDTDTRIEIPTENSTSNMITVTGRKDNVQKAKAKILAIQGELANIIEIEVLIPGKHHQSIIGPKGTLIKSIIEECGGVMIHFPSGNVNVDKVTIRGVQEEVEKAKKLLLELAGKREESSYAEEIHAPSDYHRFLIGRGGANIRKVREETGARVVFPSARDEDQTLITVIGTKAAVAEAKLRLQSLIKDLDNVSEIQINVDPKYHRHFVARRGQILREIGDENGGVTISFPRNGTDSSLVTIKGAKNCVDGAKQRIESIVQDLEQQVTIQCVIAQRHHRSLMGPKGSKVQNITSSYDVAIKFPERAAPISPTSQSPEGKEEAALVNGDSDLSNGDGHTPKVCDIITITGKKENCEQAKAALEEMIPIFKDVSVPFDYHRFIIGKKGEGIRSLMTTHDVNISIPRAEQQSDIVTVSGTATCVENAVEALLVKVRELDDMQEDKKLRSFVVEVHVDPKYHPKIIGRRGAVVTKIRTDYDVNIQFPDRSSEEQDKITIQGYEEKAVAAREAIEKIVQELEEQVSVEVEIDSRIHSRLIGGRGKTIRKVMDDYKVDIRFPRPEDGNLNLITIAGDEDNCLDCKEYLLNLEEEYLQDVIDQQHMKKYMKPPSKGDNKSPVGEPSPGFFVRDAPWSKAPDPTNTTDFPSISDSNATPTKPPIWGPSKR